MRVELEKSAGALPPNALGGSPVAITTLSPRVVAAPAVRNQSRCSLLP